MEFVLKVPEVILLILIILLFPRLIFVALKSEPMKEDASGKGKVNLLINGM